MPLAVSADGACVLCLECYAPLSQLPTGFSNQGRASGGSKSGGSNDGPAVATIAATSTTVVTAPSSETSSGPMASPLSASELFCGGACQGAYAGRRCSSTLRRQLADLDGAVCACCGLDADALCQVLSETPPGAPRAALLERLAPAIAAEAKLAAHLLDAPHMAGNAWHADHRLAVFQGGGECTVDNMQVLCVACHLAKTRREARERAEDRRRGGRASSSSPKTPRGTPQRGGKAAVGVSSAYFADTA